MIRTLALAVAVVCLGVMLGAPSLAAQTPAGAPATSAALVININTADAAGLATLPGIGAKTAELIVAYRQKNGPFKKIEELMNVRGIGEKSFLKIRAQISVTDPKRNESRP
jgi:competence protein ComEA